MALARVHVNGRARAPYLLFNFLRRPLFFVSEMTTGAAEGANADRKWARSGQIFFHLDHFTTNVDFITIDTCVRPHTRRTSTRVPGFVQHVLRKEMAVYTFGPEANSELTL